MGSTPVERLGDPAHEPTDEDLIGLSKRAFAHVRDAQEESLRKLRADVGSAREAALEWLRLRSSGTAAAR